MANNETTQQKLIKTGETLKLRLALHPNRQEKKAHKAGRQFYESA